MEINVSVSKKDVQDFYQFYASGKAGLNIWAWTVTFIWFVTLYFMVIRTFRMEDTKGYLMTFLSISIIFLILFIYFLYNTYALRKNIRLLNRKAGYTITSRGIQVINDRSNHFIPWEQIVFIDDNSNAVFLFTSGSSVFILPKRFFISLKQIKEFTTRVESKINWDKNAKDFSGLVRIFYG